MNHYLVISIQFIVKCTMNTLPHCPFASYYTQTMLYADGCTKPVDVFWKTSSIAEGGFIHVHFRVFRKKDIPKEIDELNQWLRDRWKEKDEIIAKMKDGDIEHSEMNRKPGCGEAVQFYILFAMITVFLVFTVLCGVPLWSRTTLIAILCSLLPVGVVAMERSQPFCINDDKFKRQ